MAPVGPLAWAGPLLLYASDAHAWGLHTHMYFAQLLIWAIPLADPRFRHALRCFPKLFLAATCLPDISLFSGAMRTPETRVTHQWSAAVGMLRDAQGEAERAMALGYATHLLTDVVAHNHFVPTHEQMWFRSGMLTHALSEWAMDAHLSPHLFVRPGNLLSGNEETLAAFAQDRLGIPRPIARRALSYLLCGERLLRRTAVPSFIYGTGRQVDRALPERFDYYVRETSQRLRQVNRLVGGEVPVWLPEVDVDSNSDARYPELEPTLPADFFRDAAAPSA